MASDKGTFEGRFSDGQTAGRRQVHIEFRQDGVVFWPLDGQSEGAADTWFWHYRKLSTATALRAGNPDVLLQSSETPGATLFVTDPVFVRHLATEAPHMSAGGRLWKFAKPALIIATVIAGLIGSVWALDLSPARTLAGFMPEGTRDTLGEALFRSLAKSRKICKDAAGQRAVAKMVERLSVNYPVRDAFHVRIVDWGLTNAFALPGSKIVLTRGLITNADSAEEVAGVLAHEMGHVVELHPETGVVRALGIMAAAQFIFAGSSDTVGTIGTLLFALRYNRAAEREADDIGLEVLKMAEVSPKPLAGFFERLQGKAGKRSGASAAKSAKTQGDDESAKNLKRVERALDLLSTHPPTPERIARIKAEPDYPVRPILSPAEWRAVRDICGASGTNDPAVGKKNG